MVAERFSLALRFFVCFVCVCVCVIVVFVVVVVVALLFFFSIGKPVVAVFITSTSIICQIVRVIFVVIPVEQMKLNKLMMPSLFCINSIFFACFCGDDEARKDCISNKNNSKNKK